MSRDIWSSTQYQRYADERSRPFFDLLARVDATSPATVADLGCGPGNLTVTLAERWPGAVVLGVDSSPDMLEAAARHAVPGKVEFELGTVQEWQPVEPVDILVSNAALQWVPEHRDLFRRLLGQVRPGGWFAFQVPGNFGAPSHVLLREVCRLPAWRDVVGDIPRADPVAEPADYLRDLVALGCAVDAWETTYLHVLQGEDAVLEWVKGSALRPVLAALDPPRQQALLEAYRGRLRTAYPAGPEGTVLPFRRIFVVAHRR